MSKIQNNPLLRGVSGMLGETMVIRKIRGKLQMANRPTQGRTASAKQAAIQFKFQEAAQYAKMQTGKDALEESKALYATGITDKKHAARIVAMTDYLNAPKVHYIDAQDYSGGVDDTITVKATDDFMVTGVKIVITDGNGTVIEKGEAVPEPTKVNLWTYKATVANSTVAGTTIKATAFDRPGNATSLEKVI